MYEISHRVQMWDDPGPRLQGELGKVVDLELADFPPRSLIFAAHEFNVKATTWHGVFYYLVEDIFGNAEKELVHSDDPSWKWAWSKRPELKVVRELTRFEKLNIRFGRVSSSCDS